MSDVLEVLRKEWQTFLNGLYIAVRSFAGSSILAKLRHLTADLSSHELLVQRHNISSNCDTLYVFP
jgi:hypothetical protein